MRYEFAPAPFAGDIRDAIVFDPWSVRVALPPQGDHHLEYSVAALPNPVKCSFCSAEGRETCARCGGSGSVGTGEGDHTCGHCHGMGTVECRVCEGAAAVMVTPIVVVDRRESVRARFVERSSEDELPVSIPFMLGREPVGGRSVLRERGKSIAPRVGWVAIGYRGDAGAGDVIDRAVNHLLETPAADGDLRVLGQDLEVIEVPVWRVDVEKRSSEWIYGDPPRRVDTDASGDELPSALTAGIREGAMTLGRIIAFWVFAIFALLVLGLLGVRNL